MKRSVRYSAFKIAIITLILANPLIYAQIVDGKTVQIIPYWDPGESHRFRIETGSPASPTRYMVNVTVVGGTEDGYEIEWIYSDVVAPGGMDALPGQLVGLTDGLRIEYSVNSVGQFMAILNWLEIREMMREKADAIFAEFAGHPGHDDAVASVEAMLESRKQFETVAIDEIRLFHGLHGYRYVMDDPLIYNQIVPGQADDESLSEANIVRLEEINHEYNTAFLTYDTTYGGDGGALSGYSINRQYIYHLESGWLLEAVLEKITVRAEITRTETVHIRYLD